MFVKTIKIKKNKKKKKRSVMYEQFMGDFTYRDSASREVQLSLLKYSV